MSVARIAFKGVAWLATFRIISQAFSWIVTIVIARILSPDDYGLYAMAFIVTGYAEMFSELGLGAAIIQRENIDKKELSSVFWFSFFVSSLFAISCFPISYITADIFNDSRIIPLTQAISVLFILSGLQIIPLSLLKKELEFKTVGKIQLVSIVVSGICMLLIAYMGGGVWALIIGRIVIVLTMLILVYSVVKWIPQLHFNFHEAKSFIKFGITVASGGSLYYIFENSDKFFAGRVLGSTLLGYYTFALQLARLPTDKIMVLINQVSFAAFAKLQSDKIEFNRFYLNIIKITATIIIPLFVGGYLLGEELINVLLGDKWLPIIFIFKWLCLSQIVTALNGYNNFVHDARGKPKLALFFNFICAITMSISFYIAVQYGLNAILVPWFTVYLLISLSWIVFTLKQLNISIITYLKMLATPVIGTLIMSISILTFSETAKLLMILDSNIVLLLIIKILIGIIVYGIYLWVFERDLIYSVKKLKEKTTISM